MDRRRVLFAVVCGVLPAVGTGAERDRATLLVRVPADAVVELQGVRMRTAGQLRRYQSTPLETGRKYVYSLKATWGEGDDAQVVERTVPVRAGEVYEIDLRSDAASPEEAELLELINAERGKAGLPPLSPHPQLHRAARGHSDNMARQGVLGHTLDGRTFSARMTDAGYRAGEAGENCAQGAPTPREAVSMWMQSPGHRGNILNPRYRETGIGIAVSQSGERFYTQLFAVPIP